MNTAIIFDIQRNSFVDGPGIRTTVFFKGCNLKCKWCHNPESQSPKPQILFYKDKCTGCGRCKGITEKNTEFVCFHDAKQICGKEYTVEEVFDTIQKDRPFYEASGGGITLSGGECLLQADFCAALLARLKAEGLATAVDTCGYVSQDAFDKVIPYTDLFLYDIKAIDEDVHLRCTGHSNKCILENLRYLQSCGKAVEIRVPYVPGFNDGQKEKILSFLKAFSSIVRVRILPYHNYAATKYKALGLADTLPPTLPEKREIDEFQALADSLYKKA